MARGPRRRALGALLVTCVVMMTFANTAAARADSAGDKQRVDRELAQAESSLEVVTGKALKAVTDFNTATAALPPAQAALAEANGKVVGAQSAARQAEREAAAAKVVSDTAAGEYDQAAAAVDVVRDQVSRFVAATYRGENVQMLNMVLDARSPMDLATTLGYLDRIANAQRHALAALTDKRTLAAQRRDVAAAARDTANLASAAARKALNEAVAAKNVAERAAASVQAIIDQRSAAVSAAESERGAVLARYGELKAQSDQLAAALRAAAAAPGNSGGPRDVPSAGGNGFFKMPVVGWKSSDYGMRFDPYYHVSQLHAGTDFAAPAGAPIYAAAAGTVVRTGMAGGYGNYTCVYHGMYQGKGLSTCYGHQSVIGVSVGQHVQRGQVIGKVGATGAATGDHLHFEVRLDGDPVNPLSWLPGCLC